MHDVRLLARHGPGDDSSSAKELGWAWPSRAVVGQPRRHGQVHVPRPHGFQLADEARLWRRDDGDRPPAPDLIPYVFDHAACDATVDRLRHVNHRSGLGTTSDRGRLRRRLR